MATSMMTVREAVFAHIARYPGMEAQDAWKLIYQATFGPGHLLTDPASVAGRIAREAAEAPPPAIPLEEIGGGLSRLYLSPLLLGIHNPAELAGLFRRASEATAKRDAGQQEALLAEGILAARAHFPAADFDRIVAHWKEAGRPIPRHSEAYRRLYRPAYCLILTSDCEEAFAAWS